MAFADTGIGRNIINSNVGPEAPMVTLAEACVRGDVLGYSSGWKLALATVGTAIQGRLVALADGAIADVIPVSPNPVVKYALSSTTLLTPGSYVYVEEGAATNSGKITVTQPTTAGDICNRIGIAISTTDVAFFLGGVTPPAAAITDAPAGGTGATGGAYDTNTHRDEMIAAVNAIIAALEAHGIILKD